MTDALQPEFWNATDAANGPTSKTSNASASDLPRGDTQEIMNSEYLLLDDLHLLDQLGNQAKKTL